MIYLGRNIFEFAINWADPVNQSFDFDLGEIEIGFGAEVYQALQQHVVHGWRIALDLTDDDAIEALDDFTANLTGRLVGFWLPVPIEAMEITAAVNSKTFEIKRQRLTETWRETPDVHLFFSRTGFVSQPAKIIDVADLGNGFERVTIDTAFADFASLFTSDAHVYRLHYVRLAEDVERGRFETDGWMRREVRVVELPQEYTAAETGEKPIYLYHFSLSPPMDVHWYFTSFASNVRSGANEYLAKPGINHGAMRRGVRLEAEQLEIEAPFDPNHPFALYLPIPFSRPMNVEVLEAQFATPAATTKLFVGQIRRCGDRGERIVAFCDSWWSILQRKFPRMQMQPGCNYLVYEPGTCKAIQAFFETSATLEINNAHLHPPTIVVKLKTPLANFEGPNFFAEGWIETGVRENYELRSVLASTWSGATQRLTLTLNVPLVRAIGGQDLQIVPGCDGEHQTCIDKFNNLDNFGGFPSVPDRNLSLKAIENRVTQGDKK